MSHSQFHCTGRVYLDLHGLIFETSICYWQDQPGSPGGQGPAAGTPARPCALAGVCGTDPPTPPPGWAGAAARGTSAVVASDFRQGEVGYGEARVWASRAGFEKHDASGGHRRITVRGTHRWGYADNLRRAPL